MAAVEQAIPAPIARRTIGVSFWAGAWRRFKANKAAVISAVFVAFLLFCAAAAPLVAPFPFDKNNYDDVREGPSPKHPFGTDDYGRDTLSRLIFSLRTAIAVALGAQIVNVVVGVTLGATAGYYGGRLDNF